MTVFTYRNILALIFIIVSLACLYPGLYYPMLNIYVGATFPLVGELQLYNETQSIVGSIRSLFASGNNLVAYLILLFSIVVPIAKALILLAVLFMSQHRFGQHAYRFVALIGKWSMADVFVVSIFMAFLAGQANTNITATLHDGFYYFTAYCILSIIGIQLMKIETNNTE